MSDAAQPAVLLTRGSLAEVGLDRQTVPVSALTSADDLADCVAPGVLWLPFPCHLEPTLLEDLQLALEAATTDFIVLVNLVDGKGQELWSDLGCREQLAAWCRHEPLPPVYAAPGLLVEWLDAITGGCRFDALLKQRPERGLALPRPPLRSIDPIEHPPLPEADPGPLHNHIEAEAQSPSYAPLVVDAPPGWQRPRLPQPQRPHVVQLLPSLEMGGADKFALDLCEHLPRHTDWQMSVLTTDPNLNRWIHQARLRLDDVHELPSVVPPAHLPGAIARHARSRRASALLLTHSFLGYRLLPWLAHELPELTLADYLHVEHPDWKSGGHPRLSLLQRDYLDATLCSSNHLRRWCLDHGHEERGLAVVHTNIDTGLWNPSAIDAAAVRAEHGIPPEHCLVLVAMRMVHQKQPDLLFDILRHLESRGLPFTALVCGDGDKLDWLRDQVGQAGLRQVHLLGARPNAEIKRLMAAADLFLLPTRMEGIALSLFEAMAMECVPVAAAVGGQSELVSTDTGILIDRSRGRDTELKGYLEALNQLISDPAQRQRMQRSARSRIVGQFSIEAMAGRVASALEQAARHRAPRPPLDATRAEALALEAIEASRDQHRLEERKDAVRAQFLARIARRDHRIASLEADLAACRDQLASRPRGVLKRIFTTNTKSKSR